MPDRRRHERVLRVGLLVLLVALGALSLDRAWRGRYDFHHFFLDARYVWEHRALNPRVGHSASDDERQLPFYLPVVPLALAPLAALGREPAAVVWAAAQVAVLGLSLRALRRWVEDRGDDAPAVFGVATLLAVPAFIEAARFNQVSLFVLALIVGGVEALERRPRTAGVLFGLAAVIKLLPLLFLPWLLLKRRWSAVAVMLVTILVIAGVPPLVAFGPRDTVAYHRQWWEYNIRGEAGGGLLSPDLPEHFIDRRNQSIVQVLARWTWPGHPFRVAHQPTHLEPRTCVTVAHAISAALLAGLLWATRRPWGRLSVHGRRIEAAAYAVGLLVFSPLLRQYYLVWVFPGLLLLARAAAEPAGRALRRVGWAGVVVWTAGMVAWVWPVTRLLGAHLVMVIAVGALLLLTATMERTGVSAASPDTTAPTLPQRLPEREGSRGAAP